MENVLAEVYTPVLTYVHDEIAELYSESTVTELTEYLEQPRQMDKYFQQSVIMGLHTITQDNIKDHN